MIRTITRAFCHVFLFFLLVILTLCKGTVSSVTPNCGLAGQTLLRKGQKTYVCVTINGARTSVFEVTADSFTRLLLTNTSTDTSSWSLSNQYTNDSTTLASLQSTFLTYGGTEASKWIVSAPQTLITARSGSASTSVGRIYKAYNPSTSTYFYSDIMTLLIWVNQGKIDYVLWDYGAGDAVCWFCGGLASNDCIQNSYLYDSTNVSSSRPPLPLVQFSVDVLTNKSSMPNKGKDCFTEVQSGSTENHDLQIFVSWMGTDADGKYLNSHEKRFSNFDEFALASMKQSVKNGALDIFNQLKNLL
eukprot:g3510.t1